MTTLVVLFILSLILLWGLSIYALWKKNKQQDLDPLTELTPLYNKTSRVLRRGWFATLRAITKAREGATIVATKIFFAIFPNARRAFEKKDELTGLEQGPSSYFLKSISPEKDELREERKRNRRKRKNV